MNNTKPKVLKGMFGPKMERVTGNWRKLQNEALHYLRFSRNIIRVMKSRTFEWVGHVANGSFCD
jgi:hypothetical protein